MHFIPMEILLSAAALITEGAYIQISGGVLRVNASGDGIDSNGDLTVSGGKTYLSGPVNSGNGILDYNGSAGYDDERRRTGGGERACTS